MYTEHVMLALLPPVFQGARSHAQQQQRQPGCIQWRRRTHRIAPAIWQCPWPHTGLGHVGLGIHGDAVDPSASYEALPCDLPTLGHTPGCPYAPWLQ